MEIGPPRKFPDPDAVTFTTEGRSGNLQDKAEKPANNPVWPNGPGIAGRRPDRYAMVRPLKRERRLPEGSASGEVL